MVWVILIAYKNGALVVGNNLQVFTDKFEAEAAFESTEKTEDISSISLHEVPIETSKKLREK